jgi:single-strand DNA-binding protein
MRCIGFLAFQQALCLGHSSTTRHLNVSEWIQRRPRGSSSLAHSKPKSHTRCPCIQAQLRSLRNVPKDDDPGITLSEPSESKGPESDEDDFDIESAEFRPDIPLLNSVILTGRLGQDPVLRQVGQDDRRKLSLLTFSLAVRDEVEEDEYVPGAEPTTSWFKCELWGQRAEAGARLLRKGLRIGIVGQLGFESYTNRAGEEVDAAVIMVGSFEVLQSKSESQAGEGVFSSDSAGAGRKPYSSQTYDRPPPRLSKGTGRGTGDPAVGENVRADIEHNGSGPKALSRDAEEDDGLPF